METNRSEGGWDALGDSTRRAIVACLAERPRAVGELAEVLPVSRSAVSQHLKVLKDAGLVSERTSGTRHIYRLNPVALAALRDQLDTFWQRALAGYGDLVQPGGTESDADDAAVDRGGVGRDHDGIEDGAPRGGVGDAGDPLEERS